MATGRRQVSIHAPREGSDGVSSLAPFGSVLFQSTLPVKGATIFGEVFKVIGSVSIHAPREGSDGTASAPSTSAPMFQSTLPVKGATNFARRTQNLGRFNPRSP